MHTLTHETVHVDFPNLTISAEEIVKMECYKAEEDRLEDEECLIKIEEIIGLFEGLGLSSGNRH